MIKGFLIVTVIFAGVLLASPMLDQKHIKTINESKIGSALYNHNLLVGLIK